MPYISQNLRSELYPHSAQQATRPGELCFQIVCLVNDYVEQMDAGAFGPSHFTWLSEALGALEAAKLEFYRRRVAAFEDDAIKRNGDLF